MNEDVLAGKKSFKKIISTSVFMNLFVALILFCILLVGCSSRTTTKQNIKVDLSTPEGVIDAHFKYADAKDSDKSLSLFTNREKKLIAGGDLNDIKSIKVKSITEETDPKIREGYSKGGPGKEAGVKDENFKIFRVSFDQKEKYQFKAKNYISWFTIVRKDANSPWLIDEIGQ
jgi:hypothetical protein